MEISTELKLELLKSSKIFENADSKELKRIIENSSRTRHFHRGEIIFSQKDETRAIGIILSGSAQVKKGRASISTLTQGDIFGAVTLFSDEPNPATSITAKVECSAMFFEKDAVQALILSCPQIAVGFASYLSNRIRFLTRRIELLTAGDCDSKLLSFLLDREENGVAEIESCADLARKLDVGRASLYRALDNLEKCGEIRRDGKKIFIVEKD
ncbi:MAG: Crp/Fnr family transcriptional regulator [Clostridia bacterium]|nr:Crp/Fnr family transcriptional regulator [Clostridia bacterium]